MTNESRTVALHGEVIRELLSQQGHKARWLATTLTEAIGETITDARVSQWLAPQGHNRHRRCPEHLAYEICRLLGVRHFNAVIDREAAA